MKNSIIIASIILSVSLILSSTMICLQTQKVEKQFKKMVNVMEDGISVRNLISGSIYTQEHPRPLKIE